MHSKNVISRGTEVVGPRQGHDWPWSAYIPNQAWGWSFDLTRARVHEPWKRFEILEPIPEPPLIPAPSHRVPSCAYDRPKSPT